MGSSKVKQVLIVRKDLNMRKGKICSQISHASMSFLTKPLMGKLEDDQKEAIIKIDNDIVEWINSGFTKITLYVDSEEELINIHQMALMSGLKSHLIIDKGLTEFNGVPTKTAVAIGPDKNYKIDKITGNLKLL